MFRPKPDSHDLDRLLKATWRLYLIVLDMRYASSVYRNPEGATPQDDEDIMCALIEEAHNVISAIQWRGSQRVVGVPEAER